MRAPLLLVAVLLAQRLEAREPLLERGYRQMYNLQFDAAHQSFQAWRETHPTEPIGPVSDAAAYLFSEFDRLHILESEFFANDENFHSHEKLTPDARVRSSFEEAINKARQLADRKLAQSPQDRDAAFANILRLGLHADYLSLIEKKYKASLDEMKVGRLLAQQLVASDPTFYDAYLAIGAENYILSQKIAPVRWLLRAYGAHTNKEEGIRNLRLTAEKGNYLLPFARLLLAVAAVRDEDRAGATIIMRDLAQTFPNNRLYAQELLKLTANAKRTE